MTAAADSALENGVPPRAPVKDETIEFRVPADLKLRAQHKAARTGTDLSKKLRQALEAWVDKE